MKRPILVFLFSLFLSISAFSQQAEMIDEFGYLPCDDLLARADNFAQKLEENPESKLYIIFYEGKHSKLFHSREKKKSEFRLVAPRRGEAQNKTKAISLYLTKYRKVSPNRFELIGGGYDANYRVQIWLIPNGKTPPKPLPNLKETDVKFSKGKAPKVADCQGYYNSI